VEALVITLREGIEAALVVGLILAYLNRTGRAALNRYVYAGLVLAVLASLAGAVGFSRLGLNPENEVLEGTLLAVAAVLVASLVIWMWRASRHVKRHVEDRLEALTQEGARRQGWGLLAFTFFMIFREGVEIILFLAALSLTASSGLLNLIGGAAGLGLAALFGYLFTKGSVRIDLRRFFGVTGLVLMILVLRLLAGSVHEFSEAGLLPSTPTELAVIGFIVRDTTSIVILIALILLPILAMLPSLRRRPEEEAALPGETPPQRRKRVAAQRRTRRWGMAVVAVTLAIVAPLALAVYSSAAAGYRPKPQVVTPERREVRIPLDSLEIGRLYKYSYNGAQTTVRFLIIRRDENDVAAALDACNICPPIGFHQEGDQVICDNCNAPINMATIGMQGGCNPIPLPAVLQGGEVVIDVGKLDAAQSVFAR
jgi:FTR1 family protein